eukprot:6930528-Prymnesium_polylepis.7
MQFELIEPLEALQSALQTAKASLTWWNGLTAALRAKHHSLNVCTLRKLGPLLCALESLPSAMVSGTERDALCAELQAITSLVAPGLDDGPAGALREATTALISSWQTAQSTVSQDATSADIVVRGQLQCLAESLDAALCFIPRRFRPASRSSLIAAASGHALAPESDSNSPGEQGPLPSGMHLACAETDVSALQLLLSACVHHGALPERESALLCWEGSNLEELGCFVRRWLSAGGSTTGAAAPLYVLAGVDLLPLETQHEAVTLLQHAIASATSGTSSTTDSAAPPLRPPLLLVCASSETSPVLLSLGYRRRPLRGALLPLPYRELRRLLTPMGFTILSNITGGGKSFA